MHSSYEPYGLTPLTVAASSAGSDTATVAALLKARCDPNPPSPLADLAVKSFYSHSQWIGLREINRQPRSLFLRSLISTFFLRRIPADFDILLVDPVLMYLDVGGCQLSKLSSLRTWAGPNPSDDVNRALSR